MQDPPETPRDKQTDLKAHIPNALTIARLGLAVGFFAILERAARPALGVDASTAWDRSDWLLIAAVIFILAALTDALDGFLARRWDVISTFGRVMDPFADKVLVLGAFVYLASPRFVETAVSNGTDIVSFQASGVAPWMVVLILARELLVTSIRGLYESQGVDFSAMWSGKAKMIVQSAVIPILLALVAFVSVDPGTTGWWIARGLMWVVVLITLASGFQYVARAARMSGEGEMSLALFTSTTFGLGHMRPAPGTWGSIPVPMVVGVMWLVGLTPMLASPAALESGESALNWDNWLLFHGVMVAILIVFSAATILAGSEAEARFGKKDPSEVVADETAGQAIPFLFLPVWVWEDPLSALATTTAAFLLFRIFDILKLPPANQLQKLKGGWGILVDDLVAGAQALLILQIATRLIF